METMVELLWHKLFVTHPDCGTITLAIIPTVLIPLTGLTVLLTSLASIVAGWFGIKLKTEGPKQLLELLLTKKILISAILLNIIIYGGWQGYVYSKNSAKPLFFISYKNKHPEPSAKNYQNDLGRPHSFSFKEESDIELGQNISSISVSEIWSTKLPKGMVRSGALSAGSLFLGANDGFVYEINSLNGEIIRKFYIGTAVTPRPLVFESKLFVGEGTHNTHHARIYSFDLKSGKLISTFQTKGHTEGQPLIAYSKDASTPLLFAVSGKDGIYGISPHDLKMKWHYKDGHLDATATVFQDKVFIGSGKEKGKNGEKSFAHALDFYSGKLIWKKELPLSNWMHPVIAQSLVCYALGEIYFPSELGLFYCLDQETGEAKLSVPFESPLVGKPLVISDFKKEKYWAYVSSFHGDVCGIEIPSGKKMWCQKTKTPKTSYALSSLTFDPVRNILWYSSFDNGLWAFSPSNGKILLHYHPKDSPKTKWGKSYASPTLDLENDHLFIFDISGNIKKLKIIQ